MGKFYPLGTGFILKSIFFTFFLIISSGLYAQAPTVSSANFNVRNIDGNQFYVNFTPGDGARRIIIASTNPVTAVPQNGADYVANTTFGFGNELKPGEFVVYRGSGSDTWITGLNHSTTYYFRIYEYNGVDYNTQYLTTDYLEGSGTTLSGPTVQASDVNFDNITATSMQINFTPGDGQYRLVVARTNEPVDFEPTDLVNYPVYPYLGIYPIGNGDNYALYEGSATSVTFINLSPNTTYHFEVYEFNGTNGKLYLKPGAVGSQLTSSKPTVAATSFYVNNLDGDRFTSYFTPGNGEKHLIIAKEGSPVTAVPEDGIDYVYNQDFGSGAEIAPGEFVVYNGTSSGYWTTNLKPSTTYHFRVYEYNGIGTNTFYLTTDYLEGTGTTLSAPTVQASDVNFDNITATSMQINFTPGDGQYRLVVARANEPVDFEPTDLVNYPVYPYLGIYPIGNGDNYALYEGSATSVTFINLSPNTTYHFEVYEFNGTNGKLYLKPGAVGSQLTSSKPTVAATSFYVNNLDGDRFTSYFTPGNGEKHLIIAKEGSPVTAVPEDGIDYVYNQDFGSGAEIAPGEFVVYNGTSSGYWTTNLKPSTTYHFRVYEYNGIGTNTFYLTTDYLEGTGTTLSAPTVQASDVNFDNITATSMQINFTPGDGQYRLVVARANEPVDFEPTDLVNYPVYPYLGIYPIGNGDNYALYEGSATSVTFINLSPNTTYHFEVYEFNGTNGKLYLKPGAVGSQLTSSKPTVAATSFYVNNLDGDRFTSYFTPGNGEKHLIIAKEGSPVTAVPEDGIDYVYNQDFGSGAEIAPGEFVVYNGTSSGYWTTNLKPSTTYHFRVYEYNGIGTNTFYLTTDYLEGTGTTLSPPTIQSSNAFLSSRSTTSLNISWTRGNGTNRILIGRKNGPVNVEPEDFVNYSVYPYFGYYPVGTSDNYVLYDGTGNNVNISNLEAGTNYHFALFEFNGSSGKLYLRPGYAFALETFGERPTVQISNVQFSNISFSSFDVDMTAGNGSRRLVLAREGGPVSAGPADFTAYSANSLFGQGSEIGNGNFVVYNGFGEDFSLAGLEPGKNYHFAFYEYSMSASGELYMAPAYTASQTTMGAPTTVATNFNASAYCTTEPTLTWTAGNGSGRIVVISAEELNMLPVNYAHYSANATFGNGTALGNGFVVYNGTAETITVNNLQQYLNYQVNIFEYNGTAESPYFNSTSLLGTLGDLTPPTIDEIIEQTVPGDGECKALLDDYTNLAIVTDNCDESPVVTQLPEAGTIITGTTSITLTVTDSFGNSNETSFNVIIIDETAPEIAAIPDQVIAPGLNCEAILPDYSLIAVVTDNCEESPVLTQNPVPGTVIDELTVVTITATDVAGNYSSVSFNVTVENQPAPELTCVGNQSIELGLAECTYTHTGNEWDVAAASGCTAQSTDLPTYELTGATTGNGNSLDNVKFNVGETTVTWNVINNNTTTSCSYTVTVKDMISPVIIAPEAVSANTSDIGSGTCSTTMSLGTPVYSDNCVTVTVKAFVEDIEIDPLTYVFNSGSTTVKWVATDVAGNFASDTQLVTVIDNETPAIISPPSIVISEAESTSFNLINPDASDNCGVVSIVPYVNNIQIDPTSYTFTVGITDVSWIAIDAAGNEATASQRVEVTGGCAASLVSFSGYPDNVYVAPLQGSSATEFVYQVLYKDGKGQMPKTGNPRVELDANGDGDALDPLDLIFVMEQEDPADTDVTDGKLYTVTVSGLSPITWKSRIVAENSEGCTVTTTFDSKPFVSDKLLDVSIYASDISFSKSNPAIGEPIKIYARIKNNSDFPAENFVVSLYAEDLKLSTQTVPFLAAQSNITLEWEQSFATSDFVPIKVVIDETNVLDEINELNNFAIRPIIVGDYVLPGGIEITAVLLENQLYPNILLRITGNAKYFGIEEGVDADVAGATVRANIAGGMSGETYTRSDGTFDIFLSVPNIPGVYSVSGDITDYTLSAEFGPLTFEVLEPAPLPNLVSNISLNQPSILQGEQISGVATVTNNGQLTAENFVFKYYNCEEVIGEENIASLAPGESLSFPFTVIVNAVSDCLNPHTCSFISEADSGNIVAEGSEYDNGSQRYLTVLPGKPDLTPQLTYISPFMKITEAVEFDVQVNNIGGIPSGAFAVNVYSDGILIHTENISELENCGNIFFNVNYTFPTLDDHVITVNVDQAGVIDEFREFNNTYTQTVKNIVIIQEPNLQISVSDLSVLPVLPGEGESFEITANFRNNGTANITSPFDVRFTVTEDGVDRMETMRISENLAVGQVLSRKILTSLATYGNHKVEVALDSENEILEISNTDNDVTAPLCLDFIPRITGHVWNGGFYRDTQQHLTIYLSNLGLFTAENVSVKFYLDDVEIAATTVSEVGPYGKSSGYVGRSIPYIFDKDGVFVLSVRVDDPDSHIECNEDNNVYSRTIIVKPPMPDLRVISEYISPTELNPDLDEPINIFLSFDNIGFMRSDAFITRVSVDDVQLGQDISVPALNPGETGTIAIATPYSSAVGGIRIIRGFVDPDNLIVESNETNNEASRAIIIGDAPNLFFTGLDTYFNCPENGQKVNITATIENEGDLGTDAEVQFYYIATSDTIPIERKSLTLGANAIATASINWTVVNNTFSLYAEIINTSRPEYNVLDNNIRSEFCSGEMYAVNVSATGQGIVKKSPDNRKYDVGTELELKAVPAQGWFFKNWSGAITGNTNPVKITVDGNKEVNAVFERIAVSEFVLNVVVQGSGTVVKSPEKDTYSLNEEVNLEAIPDEGHVFINWVGDLYSPSSTVSITMNSSKSIAAIFVEELNVIPVVTNSSCTDIADGKIELIVTGGSSPYTYDWDNDGTDANDIEPDAKDLLNIVSGTYTVVVTDANGLTKIVSSEVLAEESGLMYYADFDGDGLGDPNNSRTACLQPENYVINSNDCDDTNVEILGMLSWYQDADNDGFGNKSVTTLSCTKPDGYVNNSKDCDDTKETVGQAITWYADNDGDKFGNPNQKLISCSQPENYVLDNTDCSDADPSIYPGAFDTRGDGIDQDCDGKDEPFECLGTDVLNISEVCSNNPSLERRWLINNPAACAVAVRWELKKPNAIGTIIANPGDNYFTTPVSPKGPTQITVYWKDSKGKEKRRSMGSNGIQCETTTTLNEATSETSNNELDILQSLAVAPNPMQTEAVARFSVNVDSEVVLKIFDFNGREINTLFSGPVNALQVYDIPLQRNNMMSGVYILKLITVNGYSYEHQFIVK